MQSSTLDDAAIVGEGTALEEDEYGGMTEEEDAVPASSIIYLVNGRCAVQEHLN